jgi:hypothetical protein
VSSPRGSPGGGGNRKDVRNGGQLVSTFGVTDDEFQWSASDRIRQNGGGTTRRWTTRHQFGLRILAVAWR